MVGTLMLSQRPRGDASPCTHRIGNRSGRSAVAALVRGLSRFSLLPPRNAFDSTARVARSSRRAGRLVQQPGCIARTRRLGLHEGLDQHGVDQKNDDDRVAPCRLRRALTSPPQV